MSEEDIEFDLAAELGSTEGITAQRFSIYLPDKDRYGNAVPNLDLWIESALQILVEINGGATRLPIAQGRWRNDPASPVINEQTSVVYSFLFDSQRFYRMFPALKGFIDTFGKWANQDAVMIEFAGENPPENEDGAPTYFMRAVLVRSYPQASEVSPFQA
ncbi:MAG: hypothetical protein BGN82_00945 [Alphaproteobacteria bacterium 65-7]|nr:MAG: hypothetical protein BGN82_00945 [Alphaproteobacteria bacterium 65-7]